VTPREIVIEATKDERHYWADMWQYRELFFALAQREILVRYKQTVVGLAWAVVRPLLTMIVFSVIFGRLAKLPADGMPYPVLVFAALLPWQLFSTSVTEGSNSVISNAGMISKVYFPRLIVPLSSVAVSLVDALISLVILAFLMVGYGVAPGWKVMLLPLFILMTCLAALGITVLLSALNVRYRDFRFIVGFIVQFGLLVSPVGFSSSVVPDKWRAVYALNPLVGVIDGFRWCLSEHPGQFDILPAITSVLISGALLAIGVRYFRHAERTFADVI
jgi:lipopolysaccharide transport system permease protein